MNPDDLFLQENPSQALLELSKKNDAASQQLLRDYALYGRSLKYRLEALNLYLKISGDLDYLKDNVNETYLERARGYAAAGKLAAPEAELTKYFEEICALGSMICTIHQDVEPLTALYSKASFFTDADESKVKNELDQLYNAKEGFLLGDYTFFGRLPDMQIYALELMNSLENKKKFLKYYEKPLTAAHTQAEYYFMEGSSYFKNIVEFHRKMASRALKGIMAIRGKEAYNFFVEYIQNEKNSLQNRGEALTILSQHTGINFLKPPLGREWKKTDLPLDELAEWVKSGCKTEIKN
jgi:hypothetical protein